MKSLKIIDLGYSSYKASYQIQKKILNEIIKDESGDTLIMAEHPNVITLGRKGGADHIYATTRFLDAKGIEVLEVDRGGDVTIHGPGQLVTYPLFNLRRHKKDILFFIKRLEEVLEKTVRHYGLVKDGTIDLTGLWVGGKKVAFIGIGISHWATYHGTSLNVNNDLKYFSIIKPCGIDGLRVSSLKEMLNKEISMDEIKDVIKEKYCEVFEFDNTSEREKNAVLAKKEAS
ncbi:MAG: lipoyl(octanoyl) transferase LipB [Candidatus Omnitrophica bacterium]|nr:lipoyl(octanoyl) transferase LipB [Candidatus Omnitrophota bacterium]